MIKYIYIFIICQQEIYDFINMYKIFLDLINSKGIKTSDVVRATGVPASAFSDWKSGRSKPGVERLQKIADFLGVSSEYLSTGVDSRIPVPDFVPEHIDLIELYEKLSKDNKARILDLMKTLAN